MMRSNAAYFGLGVVAGSAVTALFFLFKEGVIFVGDGGPSHAEDAPAEEEAIKHGPESSIPLKDAPATNASEQVAYHHILKERGYKAESDVRAISEEEWFEGGRDGLYNMLSLTLYSDGVVANSVTDTIMTREEFEGAMASAMSIDAMRAAFLAGRDLLYFRNERIRTQYEVSFDDRTYETVTGQVRYV